MNNNWLHIQQSLPADVHVIAVSKYHSIEETSEVYDSGCRDFGESRVTELQAKHAALPTDIRWHFIGHLQTNKVRALLPITSLIHSVDSAHLLDTIDKEAARIGRIQDVLIELHVAREASKSGMTIGIFRELIKAYVCYPSWEHVRICGIMGMATNTSDHQEITRCFRVLRQEYMWMQEQAAALHAQTDVTDTGRLCPTILSMGMSDDYPLAIAEGSNMVRIGSAIFDTAKN